MGYPMGNNLWQSANLARVVLFLLWLAASVGSGVQNPVLAASHSRFDWQALVDEVDAGSVEGRFLRGVGYANLGRLAEAFDEFYAVSNPDRLGVVRHLMDENLKVLAKDGDNLLALNVMAYGTYAVGDYHRSTEYFEKVIERDPDNVWPRNFVALVYGQQGNIDRGLAHLKAALAIEPDNQYTHLLLAVAYKEQKQFLAAVYHYLRAPDAVKELKKYGID